MDRFSKVLLVYAINSLSTLCQSLQLEGRESQLVKSSYGDYFLIEFILAKGSFSTFVGPLSV